MRHLLYYSLLTIGLLGEPVMAATPARTPAAKSLHETAKTYTGYLTHTLHLRNAQRKAVVRCTEAYLLALSAPNAVQPVGELAMQHYLLDMRGVLAAGQYNAFCWLQERERAADLADTNAKVISQN